MNLPELARIRSEIATAISEMAHISPVSATRLVSAIDAGLIPNLEITYGDDDDGDHTDFGYRRRQSGAAKG